MSGTGWVARLTARCWRHRALAITTLIVTLGAVAIDLVTPLLAKAAIDHATGASKDGLKWGLPVLIGALLVAAAVRYGFTFGRRFAAGRLSIVVQDGLRRSMLDTLLHLDGRSADSIRTGQVVSRSISDLTVVQALLAQVPMALGGAVQFVLAIGIMAWLSPLLTVIALAMVPLVAAVAYLGRRRLFAATWSAQQAAAEVAGHVEETVTGVRVVKGFGQEERATDELAELGGTLYKRKLRAAHFQALMSPAMSAIPQLGLVLVIVVGGFLTLHGDITVGTFLAFSTYLATMTGLARTLTNLIVSAQLAGASADRVFDVVDHPRDPALDNTGTLPTDGALGVTLSGVDFGHDGSDGKTHPVLRDVDLTVAPGECVAVVGGPGSGKSSIAHCWPGTYRPDAGLVAVTDESGRTYDLADLNRSRCARLLTVAFDEPFLYSDTVAANIALGPVPPPEAATPALDDAAGRAAARDFIDHLPDGFAAAVGERGLTLSGGQRQRLALARAFYAQPRILVLDDATSAVDAITEGRILSGLRADRTTMVILAHRRSTLAVADRVAVLDEGRILDIGTPAELDERCPRFRELMAPAGTDDQTRAVEAGLRRQQEITIDDLWRDDAPLPAERAKATAAPGPARPGAGGGGRGGAGMASALGAVPATPQLQAAVDALPPADEDPKVDVAQARAERPDFSLAQILRPVRWLLLIVLAVIAADTLIGLVFPTLARTSLDAAAENRPHLLWIVLVVGVLLVAVNAVISAVGTVYSARAGERVLYGLRIRSYAHLQRLGLDYYERELSGRIMTRMTTDIDALSNFLQTGLTSAVVAMLTFFGVFAALVVTDWQLGLIVAPVVPVLIVATLIFRKVAAAAYTRTRELVSLVNADFQENVSGITTTVVYRHVPVALDEFGRRSADWVQARMRSQTAIAVYFPFIQFCADVAAAVALGSAHSRSPAAPCRRAPWSPSSSTCPCCSVRSSTSPRSSTATSRHRSVSVASGTCWRPPVRSSKPVRTRARRPPSTVRRPARTCASTMSASATRGPRPTPSTTSTCTCLPVRPSPSSAPPVPASRPS